MMHRWVSSVLFAESTVGHWVTVMDGSSCWMTLMQLWWQWPLVVGQWGVQSQKGGNYVINSRASSHWRHLELLKDNYLRTCCSMLIYVAPTCCIMLLLFATPCDRLLWHESFYFIHGGMLFCHYLSFVMGHIPIRNKLCFAESWHDGQSLVTIQGECRDRSAHSSLVAVSFSSWYDQLDQVGKMKRKGPTQPSLTPKIKIWGHHRCITVASPLHHRCSTWQRPHDQDLFARRSWGVWRAGWRRSSRRDHERSRTWGFDRGAIPKGVVNLFCRRIHISNKLYGFQNRWMWRINPTCYHQKGADSHGRIFDPLSTHCLLAVPGRCDSHWKIPPVRELSAKGKTERLNKKKMVCDWFAAACSCLWHDVPHDAMRWHVMTCNHIKDG